MPLDADVATVADALDAGAFVADGATLDALIAELDAAEHAPAGSPEGGQFVAGGGGAGGGSAKTQALRAKLAAMKEKTAAARSGAEAAQAKAAKAKEEYEKVSAKAPSTLAAHAQALREKIAETNRATRKIERGNTRGEDSRADARSYRVSRFDVALAPAERTKEGYLRCEGRISRAGNVQEYTLPDGRTQREYRPPEEVFAPASLASLDGVPFTKEHPPALLTAADAKQYAHGMVSQPRQDGDYIAARIVVYDADMIAAIEGGKQQLSVGYDCAVDLAPGVSPAGDPFDAIQRRILGNHVAGVDHARAGDGARIRLDAAGNAVLAHARPPVYVALQQANAATQQPEKPMPQTVRIDSATFPLDDANAPAIQAAIAAALDKARTDGVTLVSAERAKFDAAERGRLDAVAKLDATKVGVKKWAGAIKARLDAMKARAMTCDECAGSGKIDEAKCDYCDGKGTVRMHDAIKAMPTSEDPDGDGDVHPEEDIDAIGESVDEIANADDVDPGNLAQNAAIHLKTGNVHDKP